MFWLGKDKKEIEKLSTQLSKKDEKIYELSKEITQKDTQIKKLILQNSKLISKNSHFIIELQHLKNEKEKLDKELEKYQRLSKQDNDFNKVYNLIQKGKNVFITGGAGTGKSYILQHLKEYIPDLKNNITSTTGISAVNIDGVTIHSWAGIGKFTFNYNTLYTKQEKEIIVDEFAAERAKYAKKMIKEKIKKTKILAIDEISMLSDDLFRFLDLYFQKIRKSALPFGGIQIILIGDFCQLPPVIINDDNSPDKSLHYAFECQSWNDLELETVLLKTFHRQKKDIEFARHLDNIRLAKNLDEVENYLSDCIIQQKQDNADILHVFHTNDEVKKHNEMQLKNFLKEKIITIQAENYFVEPFYTDEELKFKIINDKTVTQNDYETRKYGKLQDLIENDTKAVNQLELAIGCKVMVIKNIDVSKGIANGSIGYVSEITEDCIYVDFEHLKKYPITKESFIYYKKSRSEYIMRKQYPLILAYAITIHKSQGLTFDEIVVGINQNSQYIKCGQVYVAMSRVKTKEGLHILNNFPKSFIITDNKVVDFYNSLS